MNRVRLKAYKLATAKGHLDHTYVWAEPLAQPEDAHGKGIQPIEQWACFGRDRGGKEVAGASGNGSLDQVRKLAGVHGNKGDGIVYGLNGVCHTMANRVLAESRRTVNAGVKGGGPSVVAFGYYGIRAPAAGFLGIRAALAARLTVAHAWKKRCKAAGIAWKPLMRGVGPGAAKVSEADAIFDRLVSSYRRLLEGDVSVEELTGHESRHLIASVLGADRVRAAAEPLTEIKLALSAGTGVFGTSAIGPTRIENMTLDELAAHLNGPINVAIGECRKIFKPEEHRQLFGNAADQGIRLVEPDLLRAVHGDVRGYLRMIEAIGSEEELADTAVSA